MEVVRKGQRGLKWILSWVLVKGWWVSLCLQLCGEPFRAWILTASLFSPAQYSLLRCLCTPDILKK